MWDVCPIYAGLLPETREMPIYSGGFLIVGDAAGFEAAAFGDGVPNAWFSADIAADTAIEALAAGDTSRSFLARYEEKIKADPFIIHTISDRRRWNMREILKSRDENEFRRKVRNHWGIGAFRYGNMGGPCLRAARRAVTEDSKSISSWLNMFRRYYANWEQNRFDRLSTD
jgi:flavin-dependent dehydrogenase